MRNGARPTKPRHLNFDFIKSFHPQIYAGTAEYPTFPPEYLTDDGSWMPDQNADGLPDGCTDYGTANLAKNLGVSATPQELENITNANKLGGYSIQMALDAARTVLKWFTATYEINATGILDYFDAFRLAQSSGIPEKRSISWGTPWFLSWENAARAGQFIMPMPTNAELTIARTDPDSLPWHDSALIGWTPESGVTIYNDKSWQGTTVGRKGMIGFTRETINTVMALNGTAAFTASDQTPNSIETIDLSFIETWISYIRTWTGIWY